MKKIIKTVLIALSALIAVALIAFIAVYFTRFQTLSSIKKLTDYADGYDLYSIKIKYDYDTQNIIDANVADTQEFTDAVIKESMPLLPIKIEVPSFGCSTYRAFTDYGDTIMGRNYDFKLDTSCLLVYCEPEDGYKNISFSALNNVSANHPDESFAQKMACLSAPFTALDGINEKGVSIAILTLDSEPTDQHSGKERITSSIAVRLVLDHAATTREAVDILRNYDMYAPNGRDYHFFISDASGDSRVIEYDCMTPERTFTDTPIPAITNFFGMYIDRVESFKRNGIYGHGKERYDYMMEIIEPNNDILTDENARKALQAASTEPNPENVTSNTQWSIIFNNTNATADIAIRRNWDDIYSFKVGE